MVALAVSQSLATLEWLSGGHFSPATLFATSEPGVWFDPSDVANTNWRYNLLTFTEQFDNAAWTKGNFLAFGSGSVANTTATTDPIGGNTADLLVTAAATTSTRVFQSINSNTGQINTQTWYVKKQAGSAVRWLRLNADQSVTSTYFDLDNGVFGTVGAGITPFVISLPNGWYRIGITYAAAATDITDNQFLNLANGNNMPASYVGDGTSGFYIWGAQTEIGSTPTEYQPITTVAAGTIARFPQATLYQDSAGSTLVTAPSQPVGLMLSKDKGLALGPELVVNGDFATSSNWTLGATWSISGGVASKASGDTATIFQDIPALTSGAIYVIELDQSYAVSPFSVLLRVGAAGAIAYNSPLPAIQGRIRIVVNAAAAATRISISNASSTASGTIDNISIKLLPGNHATQATAGSRPTYGIVPATGRRNLLTRTEEFDNTDWAKVQATVSANTVVAPNGTITADSILDTAVSNIHYCAQDITSLTPSGKTYTVSAYAKANTLNFMTLGISDISSGTLYATAVFNLSTGAVSTSGAAGTGYSVVSSSISDAGSGWYRCVVTVVAGTSVSFLRAVVAPNKTGVITGSAGGFENYLGNGSSFYAWGVQLEQSSSATAYQQVVTAFEVTEANVASLSYLSFDGIDDFMITPTITPATDKVQVFAGVRKLSDAATSCIAELSVTLNSNQGSFFLLAPNANASTSAIFASKGSLPAFGSGSVADMGASPVTRLLSGIGDISTDTSILRINGAQAATSATDQGTGNYLAYPLYIGRRAGTSLPFTGQMYGLITRFGSNLNTSQLVSTEGWLNTKTRAY
jgi:hypothetical protein